MELSSTEVLFHAGVKGMKWGRRKARQPSGSSGQRGTGQETSAQKEARKQEFKKCVKIGAGVAGGVLAIYGIHKVSKFVKKRKRANKRMINQTKRELMNLRRRRLVEAKVNEVKTASLLRQFGRNLKVNPSAPASTARAIVKV